MYWTKGAGDNFSSYDESENYFVCEHHFKADDIHVSLGIGWKTLKLGVIPSTFNFKNLSKTKPRKSPGKNVYQLQMNPPTTVNILKRNLKVITQMTYSR